MTRGQLVDVAEAATMLGLCKNTVRRRIADGTLDACRVAGTRTIRIRRADVEALLRPIPSAAA